MIYKDNPYFADDTETVPVTFTLLAPARLKIRKPDGSISVEGFGIGEQLVVLKARLSSMIPRHELLDEIPLADGSFIIEYPSDIKYAQVWA